MLFPHSRFDLPSFPIRFSLVPDSRFALISALSSNLGLSSNGLNDDFSGLSSSTVLLHSSSLVSLLRLERLQRNLNQLETLSKKLKAKTLRTEIHYLFSVVWIFDIWCLHIPVMDRTPFKAMVELVEMTIKAENSRSPGRPMYLIGESIGGCIAMAIAAHNPDIDLLLILVNPATSFSNSRLQPLAYLLEITPQNLYVGVPSILSL